MFLGMPDREEWEVSFSGRNGGKKSGSLMEMIAVH